MLAPYLESHLILCFCPLGFVICSWHHDISLTRHSVAWGGMFVLLISELQGLE